MLAVCFWAWLSKSTLTNQPKALTMDTQTLVNNFLANGGTVAKCAPRKSGLPKGQPAKGNVAARMPIPGNGYKVVIAEKRAAQQAAMAKQRGQRT